MGGKEPNKEDTRMKGAEREDEESIKRKRKTELSELQNTLCPLLPQGLCTCNCFYLENSTLGPALFLIQQSYLGCSYSAFNVSLDMPS